MAQIPLHRDTIIEMLSLAAQRADVTLSDIKADCFEIGFTMTCELGSVHITEISDIGFFVDDKERLQARLNKTMTSWWDS